MNPGSKLDKNILDLHRLRWLVAFLGSKGNAGWWDCSFMESIGIQYLVNVFPRSAFNAAFQASVEVAQKDHDAALGRIGSYHLFRFPLHIEHQLQEHQVLDQAIPTTEMAMDELAALAGSEMKAPEGPIQIGQETSILSRGTVQKIAALYHSSLQTKRRCFPYLSPAA